MIAALKTILETIKGVPGLAAELEDTASLIDDVGLDSLEMLTFLLRVESELDVEIDFEQLDFGSLHSLRSLSHALESMRAA